NGDELHFDEILSAITQSGALEYTRQKAEAASQRAAEAIKSIPDGPNKVALLELAAFAVSRTH
ncbi:MAG: octaprenyl diphosphate synthase, partial [Polynucleobacter sp.]|nr:octaprenyl diphosphate synthase [Polynucleobacter sp.]